MRPSSDFSSSPFRTREWLRLIVACLINFSIVTAPCHGFRTFAELPAESASDGFLVASLLPELAFAELAVPMLDAGGSSAAASSPTPRLDWRAPAPARYWRSPALPPQSPRSVWPTDVLDRGSLVRVNPASALTPSPFSAAQPWQPGALPPGSDPLPLPGVFGALPLEQEAGNCVIFGEVASGLEPVAKAFVDVIGTGRVAETDAQGRFRIEGLPAGDFTVEASALNYNPEVRGVSMNPAAPVELRFNLTVKPAEGGTEEYTLEEESVVGEFREESQGDFIVTLATDNPTIVAGLSKDDISRTGSSDAAAAVSKISGANIVGGKYAVVRGLGDRYSNTLFNGALIPSADPSKKAVQLDLFPSDLLQSVAITKLFSPELPAEFAGGTVQITTLQFPEKPIIEVGVGTKWFEQRPDGGFLGDPNVKTNFSDMNLPGLPAGYDVPNGFDGSVEDSLTLHRSAPMRASRVDDDFAQSLSVILGNTFQVMEGIKVGAIFALTRDTENSYQELEIGRNYSVDNPTTAEPNDAVLANTRNTENYGRELTFGTMAGLSIDIADRHEIGYTRFSYDSFEDDYSRSTNADSTFSSALFVQNPYGVRDPVTGEIVRALAIKKKGIDVFEPIERSLDIDQFSGRHVIYGTRDRGATVSWSIADAAASESRPHSRTHNYSVLDFSYDPRFEPLLPFFPDGLHPEFGKYETSGDADISNAPPDAENFRESLSTNDEGQNERIDFSLPYYFNETDDDRVGLSFGYNRNQRTREVRGRFFVYDFRSINDELLIEDSAGNYQGNYGNQFLGNYNSGYFPSRPGTPIFGGSGIIVGDFSGSGRTVRNVDAGTELDASYMGLDFKLAGWNASGGFRREAETRSYQVLPGLNPDIVANPVPIVSEEDTILPGVTLTRTLGRNQEMTVTTGWSRTVARPTFYEFAPIEVVDQATGDRTRGNASLTNSSISNFDLRFDWKKDADTNFGVGLFHKDIVSPIVAAFDPDFSANSWINGNTGSLQGIEMEANRLFADRYRFGGNFTYLDSELKYNLAGEEVTTGFEGQPDYIVNLFAGYENEETGYAANLVYNLTGSYLSLVPLSPTVPAVVEDSFTSLDLILSKELRAWGCDGKVKLTFRNLLDSTRRQFYEGTAFTYREGSAGRSVSLSFDAEF